MIISVVTSVPHQFKVSHRHHHLRLLMNFKSYSAKMLRKKIHSEQKEQNNEVVNKEIKTDIKMKRYIIHKIIT